MSKEYFAPLRMEIFPHDIWMSIWEAYGDPCVPPSPEDILHLVTLAMVSSTPDEITPPSSVAPIDPVPATDASDSM